MLAAVVEILLRVPELVVAEEVNLRLVVLDGLVSGCHEGPQVGFADTMLDPELRGQAREVVLVVILDVAVGAERVLHVAAVLDFAVLAVHDQRHVVLHRHVQREVRLPVDERLERVTQVLRGQASELARDLPVGRAQNVVEAGLDERV